MPAKILIGLDASDNARRAVAYVGKAFGQNPEAQVTLFHVLPGLPPKFLEEGRILTPEERQARDQLIANWKQEQEKAWEEVFDEAKKALINHGFKEETIQIKAVPQHLDVAQEILDEAEAGGYTTVVLGRRGMSPIKRLVMGSVSRKVMEYGGNFSVIVVD
ncbi:MAG: universal stress protein [Desulfobacteraceae bacterium]